MTLPMVEREALTEEEEDFLRAMARALIFLPRTFVADLGRDTGLSMSEYFVMMYVSESPNGRLRMGELAAQTALSLPAVTRLVKQLAARGYVVRHSNGTDRRVHEVALTEDGAATLDLARPKHVASVRSRILDKLDGVDLRAAQALLERVCDFEPTPAVVGRNPS